MSGKRLTPEEVERNIKRSLEELKKMGIDERVLGVLSMFRYPRDLSVGYISPYDAAKIRHKAWTRIE